MKHWLVRATHRLAGACCIGLFLLTLFGGGEEFREITLLGALYLLPIVVMLAIGGMWRFQGNPGWVMLHLNLMLFGVLTALAAIRLPISGTGHALPIIACGLLGLGVAAGWKAGRSARIPPRVPGDQGR